jgi:hypothetical protein
MLSENKLILKKCPASRGGALAPASPQELHHAKSNVHEGVGDCEASHVNTLRACV